MNDRIIELDRIKYERIEHLIDDYDFIKKPYSGKIFFYDLMEAGHYYPYSNTETWRFNGLYHIYKNLNPNNYQNTYFYNNDINIFHNHKKIVELMKLKNQINVRSFPWYAVCNGYRKGNYLNSNMNKGILYNVIFLVGEQRLNRMMILNELHNYENFCFSNRNPKINNPEIITKFKVVDDEIYVNDIVTNSDLISPHFVFRNNNWCTSQKKTLTEKNKINGDLELNILGDVPLEYEFSGVELVGESFTDKGCCLSEKVLKPLFYKKPFLTMAGKNYHSFLKQCGFRLYENLFDYSFDTLNFKQRYDSIIHQIKNILNLSRDQLSRKIKMEKNNLEYNNILLLNLIKKYNIEYKEFFEFKNI